MKYMKAYLSFFIILALACIQVFPVHAQSAVIQNDNTISNESFEIAGVKYSCNSVLDEEGNRTSYLYNHNDGTLETIYFNYITGSIFINGREVAKINYTPATGIQQYDANWILLKSETSQVTWEESISLAAAAVILGGAIGQLGGAAVIAAMGIEVLGVIVSSCNKAIVTTSVYKFNSSTITQFKYIWTIKPDGGNTYGPFYYVTPAL